MTTLKATTVPGGESIPALHLVEAAFGYGGRPAAHGLSFRVEAGEAVAVIGANGSGKSTLLKGVLGLVPRLGGRIEIQGNSRRDPRRTLVGYLPQSDSIDPELPVTLRQIVTMGRYRRLGLFRWPSTRDRNAVADALELVGLTALASRRFGDLSGGQRQRGLLARAIAAEPALLLLDEPFNGLDQSNRVALLDAIERLKAQGVAVLVSTHDLQIARDVCEKVLFLDGEQVAYGPRDEVLTLENVQATFLHVQVGSPWSPGWRCRS